MVVKDTSLKTVSGDRRIQAISVEKPKILVGVSVGTLDLRAVSVETPTIQGLDEIGKRRTEIVEQPDCCPPVQVNGCPQFTVNECKEHYHSKLDTVTIVKLKFLIDTGADISVVRSTSLRPGFSYEST